MSVAFRNVDVDPRAPVATWPYEAIVTVIERGTVGDWATLSREIRRDPWGVVARQVEDYLSSQRPYGVAPLLDRVLSQARTDAVRRERDTVAAEVSALIAQSGLPLSELAPRLGTSSSRLSTYRTGRVVPSAAFMVRLRHLVAQITEVTQFTAPCGSTD